MEIKFSGSNKGPDNQKYEPKIVNISFLSVLTFVFVNSLNEICILGTHSICLV